MTGTHCFGTGTHCFGTGTHCFGTGTHCFGTGTHFFGTGTQRFVGLLIFRTLVELVMFYLYFSSFGFSTFIVIIRVAHDVLCVLG